MQNATLFGLELFRTSSWSEVLDRARANQAKPQLLADRFTPSTPGPNVGRGEAWSGSFSGPGSLPAKTPIRVVLGRFVIEGPPPNGLLNAFLCVSDRVIRLR